MSPLTSSAAAHLDIPRTPSRIEAVGIVIPARNRADTIGQCIFSLFAANDYSGWHHSLWIVVVADACTDHTARRARQAVGAFGEVLEIAARSNRMAHRLGTSAVLEHFCRKPRHALLLAAAGADAPVSRDWIDASLQSPASASVWAA